MTSEEEEIPSPKSFISPEKHLNANTEAQSSWKQEQETLQKYYVNFDPDNKDGPLNSEWCYAKSLGKTNEVILTIERGQQCPELFSIMFFHGDLIKTDYDTPRFLYRSLFQKQLRGKKIQVPNWPLFKKNWKFLEKNSVLNNFKIKESEMFQISLFTKKDIWSEGQSAFDQWVCESPFMMQVPEDCKGVKVIVNKDETNSKLTLYIEAGNNKFGPKKLKDYSDQIQMEKHQEMKHKANLRDNKEAADKIEQINKYNLVKEIKRTGQNDPQRKEQFPIFHQFSFMTKFQLDYEILYYQFEDTHQESPTMYEMERSKFNSFIGRILKKKEVYLTQNQLKNCYYIATMDQIISKADFILDRVLIYEIPRSNHLCAIINIDGRPEVISVTFDPNEIEKGDMYNYASFSFLPDHRLPIRRVQKCVQRAIIIEQCLSKVFKNFNNLAHGSGAEVFMMMTNHNTTKIKISEESQPEKENKLKDLFQTWQEEAKNIQKIYQKMREDSKRKKQYQSQTSYSFTDREMLPCYHLIIVVLSRQQALKKIFCWQNQQEKNMIQSFAGHAYSFQGYIQLNKKINNNNIIEQKFIKLRQPRGSQYAQTWRRCWTKNINNDSTTTRFMFELQEQYYKVKGKNFDFSDRIYFRANQFIISLKQFFQIFPIVEVCKYYPYSRYESFPIHFINNESTNHELQIKYEGECWVSLHQKNKRHHPDYLNKLEELIQKKKKGQSVQPDPFWNYHQVYFELFPRIDSPGILFARNQINEMTSFLNFKFEKNKKYRLKTSVFQQGQYAQYRLSILSAPDKFLEIRKKTKEENLEFHYGHSKNICRHLYGHQDKQQQKYSFQRFDNFVMSSGKQQHHFKHFFKKSDSLKTARMKIFVELSKFEHFIANNINYDNFLKITSTPVDEINIFHPRNLQSKQIKLLQDDKAQVYYEQFDLISEQFRLVDLEFNLEFKLIKNQSFSVHYEILQLQCTEQQMEEMKNQSEQQSKQKSSIDFPPVVINNIPNLNYEEAQSTKATGTRKNQQQEKKESKPFNFEDYDQLFQQQMEEKKFEDKQVSDK